MMMSRQKVGEGDLDVRLFHVSDRKFYIVYYHKNFIKRIVPGDKKVGGFSQRNDEHSFTFCKVQ